MFNSGDIETLVQEQRQKEKPGIEQASQLLPRSLFVEEQRHPRQGEDENPGQGEVIAPPVDIVFGPGGGGFTGVNKNRAVQIVGQDKEGEQKGAAGKRRQAAARRQAIVAIYITHREPAHREGVARYVGGKPEVARQPGGWHQDFGHAGEHPQQDKEHAVKAGGAVQPRRDAPQDPLRRDREKKQGQALQQQPFLQRRRAGAFYREDIAPERGVEGEPCPVPGSEIGVAGKGRKARLAQRLPPLSREQVCFQRLQLFHCLPMPREQQAAIHRQSALSGDNYLPVRGDPLQCGSLIIPQDHGIVLRQALRIKHSPIFPGVILILAVEAVLLLQRSIRVNCRLEIALRRPQAPRQGDGRQPSPLGAVVGRQHHRFALQETAPAPDGSGGIALSVHSDDHSCCVEGHVFAPCPESTIVIRAGLRAEDQGGAIELRKPFAQLIGVQALHAIPAAGCQDPRHRVKGILHQQDLSASGLVERREESQRGAAEARAQP